ncbi:MAG TPA: hypothetical protein VEU30_05060, partial [Thermoanaerobaculia bacterium]|nr:hypothetical protein [Thermoanaerobaculia bacterium]
ITKDDDVKKIMGMILKPSGGSTTRTDDAPPSSQDPPKSRYWEGNGLRIVVDSFTRTGNAINATIAVENLRDQELAYYEVGRYYLLDENGEHWGGRTADGNASFYISVPARSRVRTRWSFQPGTSPTGTVFTLVGGSNMTVRGLRPTQ